MRSLKYTNNDLMRKAREHFSQTGRVPRLKDFSAGLTTTIRRRFGSWENYVQSALEVPANSHHWTEDELIHVAREFWSSRRRYPSTTEICASGRGLHKWVLKYFGSMNEFLEKAIGRSPRSEILSALRDLTPPGCNEATPQEIIALIRQKMEFPINLYSMTMRTLSEQGFVNGGQFDRVTWWRLTPRGEELLAKLAPRARLVSSQR